VNRKSVLLGYINTCCFIKALCAEVYNYDHIYAPVSLLCELQYTCRIAAHAAYISVVLICNEGNSLTAFSCLMLQQVRRLCERLVQCESHRRSLVFQKRYLQMLISSCGEHAVWSGITKYNPAGCQPRRQSSRFRVAVYTFCFIHRCVKKDPAAR
jgi:hypothetical protein